MAVLDRDASHCDIGAIAQTCAAIELPRVPRANDRMVVQRALRERCSAMRTGAFDRVELSANIADDVRASVRANLGHAPGREFGYAPDAYGYHMS